MKFEHNKVSLLIASIFLINTGVMHAADLKVINGLSPLIGSNDLHSALNLSSSYHFKASKDILLPNGNTKHRMSEYYLNVPVRGVSIAETELKTGQYDDFSGSYLLNIEMDLRSVEPEISKADVFKVTLKKMAIAASNGVRNKEATLFIMQDQKKKARLVYQVSFMIDNEKKPQRPYFIVDANNGEILKQWDGLTTRDAFGPGGNEKTGQYRYGTDYGPLVVNDICEMDSPNVWTFDMHNQYDGGNLHKFTCPENSYKFTNGAYSPLNDAHYFGNVVFDMYKQWFDAAPLTFKLKMRVHYSVNYDNAFWDGEQMTFGDGAYYFYPLVSLDVVAHEVSHGFTEQNSGLEYYGQAGGMNEAFSDIAGEAGKYFANPNKPQDKRNDWLVGGSIMRNDTALRYFMEPAWDGRSISHTSQYYEGLDVHYSSGVYNKAFYTLATKSGWNTETAFRAFVLANQVYWNQTSNFDEGGCGVKKAAKDLGYSTQDVIDAFNVVGVNASCNVTPPPGQVELQSGVPVTNIAGSKSSETFYSIDVPAGKSRLEIKISGGVGDADLYVLYKAKPTTSKYDCAPFGTSSNETCSFPRPASGKYNIMIRGYTSYNGVTLVATY